MKKVPLKTKICAGLASLWMRSLRFKFVYPDGFRPGVLGLWHKDLLACAAAFKDCGVHVLVSESGDGEMFALAAECLGYRVTRGSDSHGSENVRRLLETLKAGGFAGMALDGPRGPAQEVKPGSPWLSRVSGTPLWLLQPHYGWHKCLNTWDRFVIPIPLTTIVMEIKYLCDANEKDKGKEK